MAADIYCLALYYVHSSLVTAFKYRYIYVLKIFSKHDKTDLKRSEEDVGLPHVVDLVLPAVGATALHWVKNIIRFLYL